MSALSLHRYHSGNGAANVCIRLADQIVGRCKPGKVGHGFEVPDDNGHSFAFGLQHRNWMIYSSQISINPAINPSPTYRPAPITTGPITGSEKVMIA